MDVTPRLEIHLDRIAANAAAVVAECARHGVQVAAVTKVMQAHPALLRALADSGAAMIADSRVDNLRRVAQAGLGLPTLLLRAPTPRNAAEAVRWAIYARASGPIARSRWSPRSAGSPTWRWPGSAPTWPAMAG